MNNPPKHPPHSIEAEMSVLGGMLLDNRKIDEIADVLTASDFYTEANQRLYKVIIELNDQRVPTDFVTLSEHLRKTDQLESVGGLSYVGGLVSDTPSAANVKAYAEIVRERAVMRALIAAGLDTAELGYRPEGRTVPELIDEAEQKMLAIRNRTAKATAQVQTMATLISIVNQGIEDASQREDPITGLKTGFIDLDRATTGLQPGDLVIVAGRPSMGKTSFAMNIAEYAATRELKRVLVFSMEMPGNQLAMRSLSSQSRVPLMNIRTGRLSGKEWDSITGMGAVLREAPMLIDEAGGLSPMDIRSRARRIHARTPLSLIVIDYIQLMQIPGSKENRTNVMSEISRSLKALAKELSIPVVALSQLNRGLENRDNKRPRMADLRESGGIEQDADIILFVYRDEVYNPDSAERGVAEIIISKQRNGPLDTVRLVFDGPTTRFSNLAASYGGHHE